MYNSILVPLDGSELAECVLPHVNNIANGCGVQDVFLLRVVEPIHLPSGFESTALSDKDIKGIDSNNLDSARNYLDNLADHMKFEGTVLHSEIMPGKASEIIVDYATKKDVDLIVIATHGYSGISRWIWGSVADRVLRSACIPVLMIRAPGCVPGI